MNYCNNCPRFMKTLANFLDGTTLVLVVPQRTFENYEQLCLCIAQSLPQGLPTTTTVAIQSGYQATNVRFPLQDTAGNAVFAYQLKCRRRYPITATTTNNAFVISPRYLERTTTILTGGGNAA